MEDGAIKRTLRRFVVLALAALASYASGDAAYSPRNSPPWGDPVASSRMLAIGGASIQLDFGPGNVDLAPERIITWVANAAQSVSVYYGRFPVGRDRILVEFDPGGRGVRHGTTWGGVGGFPAFTRIHLGEHTTQQDLDGDWMMTHELIHTGFPSMEDDHHWIEEGLAVYVEPIARVQNGLLRPEKIWGDMMRDMPQGDPLARDEGLDQTHTWGRTYWGGAQFCLLADVTMRKQTHNNKGLEDALRGIIAAGGTINQDWSIEKTFAIGDQATGTHVLTELYSQMKNKPIVIGLDGLWKDLGVERTPDGVRLDEKAPFSDIRKAITVPEK